MRFDIVNRFPDPPWLEEVAGRLDGKMQLAVRKAGETDFIPYSTEHGRFKPTDIGWWTNGFWPASMWQMYRATGRALYREEAVRAEKMLDRALERFKDLDHDVGFMWLIHSGVRYRLERNPDSYDRTLFAANMLAARFNPNGFIRAWNGEGREGVSIVDSMMNLPLLYWASRVTGDPRYRLIAMAHADTGMRHFVRPDGSCNHIVVFDAQSGRVLDRPAGQGYASGSSWSRGQAWALYGFTLSYLCTGKPEYLYTARRVAGRFIGRLAGDYVPRCDFDQPPQPDLRDNAAGNIAACGLLELCRVAPQAEAPAYYDAAVRLLKAQEERCADWSEQEPALFHMCTSAYHDPAGRHMSMQYADYFFIEAIGKLRGETLLFWQPEGEAGA